MSEVLRPAVYNPSAFGNMTQEAVSPLVQGHALNDPSFAPEDEGTIPRYYFAPRYSTASSDQYSEYEPVSPDFPTPRGPEDFPTPKARLFDMTQQCAQPSPRHPLTSPDYSSSQSESDRDSLYDITDDEAEVPLRISASVKKVVSRNRYPSLVIPSPSTWPTIEKLQSAISARPPTSAVLLSPSRHALNLITSHNLRVPSAAPSLDGSMTSEEMDRLSCPSTPDTHKRRAGSELSDEDWAPMQLDLQAMETLNHLGQSPTEFAQEQQAPEVIETGEMQEVARPSFLSLQIPKLVSRQSSMASSPVSQLSIPSPGGFFSSLQSTARHTWSIPTKQEIVPNTSVAERFYNLPWQVEETQDNTTANRDSTLAGSTLDGFEGLPTPKPTMRLEEEPEIKEINPSKITFQYNESYHAELQKNAAANLERTGHWLEEQDELQAALREMSDLSSPSSSQGSHSRNTSIDQVIHKKSVKFADDVGEAPEKATKKIDTYVQGFEYLRDRTQRNDAYIHRQARAEAMHVRRRCMPQAHRDQLLGKFELTDPVRPAPPRPVSEFFMNDPTVFKERIARAQSERQALDQMASGNWVLQAQKHINGGRLLSKPAHKIVRRAPAPRILDVGGVAVNNWAWQISYDYPHSTVTTVYTSGHNPSSDVKGPANHKCTTVPNMWTFPFPNAHFDVISARTLHELLKTDRPLGKSSDEYDLCVKECFRVLKKGGVLDFSLLDADIIHAGRQAQAMAVEFGFNLKTRGYDAQPTKSFLPRLSQSGFSQTQRAWVILPFGKTTAKWNEKLTVGAGDNAEERERMISAEGDVEFGESDVWGNTIDAAMMTGLVGSWMYEKWMLKLQMEMGKEKGRLLEGVERVLEEGAEQGSAWRYLTGYARK